jgi:O-succinylbenzoate synthase
MRVKDCRFETILIDSRCLRKGILIHLTSEDGQTTSTEASPLPGFSKESFEQALQQLQSLKRRITTTWWTKGALHYLSTLDLYPSVHFAVESALLDLLEPVSSAPCKHYALLFGSPAEIAARADEIYAEGYTDVKVKLGHFSVATAHEIVDRLAERFRVRVDLNRKWDLEDSMHFCLRYPADFFAYIEEPTTSVEDLEHFTYPYALDETLREVSDLGPLLRSEHLEALILKPTMLFPLEKYLKLGPKVVLTSSFESPVGIQQIQRLVHRFQLTDSLHGLDTLRYFDEPHEPLPHCQMAKASP